MRELVLSSACSDQSGVEFRTSGRQATPTRKVSMRRNPKRVEDRVSDLQCPKRGFKRYITLTSCIRRLLLVRYCLHESLKARLALFRLMTWIDVVVHYVSVGVAMFGLSILDRDAIRAKVLRQPSQRKEVIAQIVVNLIVNAVVQVIAFAVVHHTVNVVAHILVHVVVRMIGHAVARVVVNVVVTLVAHVVAAPENLRSGQKH